MGAALVFGLANMGTAGLKTYDNEVDKKRRLSREDEELAWQNEQRAAIRAERDQKQQLKTSLAEAARPAQVDRGYQVTDDAGSNAFTKDADAAAVMGDMVADQRPSLAGATRVQDTAYRDPKQAQTAEQQYNSTPATLGRMSEAAMPIDAERGLKLADSASTAAKTQKALKDEEIAQVNELFNRQILTIASSGPDWSVRAAEALTKSSAPGLQGVQVESVPSPDGKMVSFKINTPSGESKIVGTYENTERGAEQWVRDSARVDFKTKIGWLNENMKHERELEKIAARDKGDKAPAGYRFTSGGALEAIPGGPATKQGGDKAPSGYRFKPDGSLEAIPGGPGDKVQSLKPLPTSAAGGLISNFQNLRRAEDALALLSGQKLEGGAVGDPQATGLKNMLPNQVLNRIDPKGVDTRAAVADLGSLVIHDRSGAAVTASEFPRLAPFIPTATDDPATARKKLAQFVQNYKATVEDTAEFYRASGYNVPTDTLRTSNSLSSATTKAKTGGIPRISSPADAAKLPSGTEFFDPNGVKRKVP